MTFANKSFLCSQPAYFLSFSCLISLAKPSSMTLKRSGEKENPHLVPDLSGLLLSFSLLNMMLVVGFL
jgi:hypothetical protein